MDPFNVITIIMAAISLIVAVYGVFLKRDVQRDLIVSKFSSMETKVDFLWKVMVETGIAGSIRIGFLEKNSPLRLSVHALEQYGDLIIRVKDFYTCHKDLPDLELMIALDKDFSDDITEITTTKPEYTGESIVLSMLFVCRPTSSLFAKYNMEDWK